MNIIYTSENKIYSFENSNKTEIPCGRVIKYKETLDSIRRRSEWKTTGSGAMFTGTAMKAETIEMPARITGLACYGDKDGGLIYGFPLPPQHRPHGYERGAYTFGQRHKLRRI